MKLVAALLVQNLMSTTNPQHQSSPPKPKVIVIGAGFSGLSVAYHLLKSDACIDLEIIEARNRVGGRVHSFDLGGDGVMVDLGGQWVHEASPKNPIRRLMEELEIPFYREKNSSLRHVKNAVFDRDGKNIDAGTQRAASKFFYKALDNYREQDVNIHTSFQDLLNQRMDSLDKKSNDFVQVLNYKSHQTACYEGGRLHELSVYLDEMYENLGGPDEYPDGGYNNVLNKLVAKIGLDKIRFGCIVESIDYNDNVTLTVKHNDTATPELIHGDYCVCTIPLGVLQKRSINFSPQLPQTRWTAVDSIGFGLLDKIVLRFDHPFWPRNYERFGAAHSDPARVKSFYDCSPEVGAPVLIAFLGGDSARRVDSIDGLSDDEAVAETMTTLRSIFCKANVPDPIAFAVTRWHTDPFAFGAYSFAKVGCTEDAYDEVSTPIGPLLFAGEHTSKTSHSTVHGAWETGHREAKRLLGIMAEAKKKR